MAATAVLVIYGLIIGWVVDRYLARADWVSAYPRQALFAWHASALACLGSLTGATLLVAHDVLEHALIWLLHADKAALHLAYAGDRSIDGLWNGAVLLPTAVLAGVVAAVATKSLSAENQRRRLRLLTEDSVRLTPGSSTDVVVIEHDVPAAYCMPGRRGAGWIVVTTAAVEVLTPTELEATIEHERTHLQRRHHRMIVVAESVTVILGWTRALRSYPAQVRRLVEMDADDTASARYGRRTVASALLEMCSPSGDRIHHLGGLSFSGSEAAQRIRRLIGGQRPEGQRRRVASRLLVAGAAVMLVVVPPMVVLLPAASLAGSAH